MPLALRIRDEPRTTVAVQGSSGSDLAEDARGWLWRAYRDGSRIKAGRSTDAGVNWTDEVLETGVGIDAAPTLATDERGNVWCWYHLGDTARAKWTEDGGASWDTWTTIPGFRYPRAVILPHRTLLLLWANDQLALFHSDNWGRAPEGRHIFILPAQLPALRADRRGYLHLVYRAADGYLVHRWSEPGNDGLDWPGTNVWEQGRFPGLALGDDRGLATWWDADEILHAYHVDEAYSLLDGAVQVPSGTFERGYHGVLIDRRGQSWLSLRPEASAIAVRWSGNPEQGWEVPA